MTTAYDVAAAVVDPELPVLTLADLGVLRGVTERDGAVEVAITPTYSGCPAIATMRDDLVRVLRAAGYADVRVRLDLTTPWTTDWISARGREALAAAGISPPGPAAHDTHDVRPVPLTLTVRARDLTCPHCGAPAGAGLVSEFGPTACTALYRCPACAEPFEHVKEL